ncbi:hypothetical protein ACI68E_001723 [Malassezia pachydermatis]
MGFRHREYLNSSRVYGCSNCKTHITAYELLISKEFNGQFGRAYLVEKAWNVDIMEPEERTMRTGTHTVCDIVCTHCNDYIGWKYIRAHTPSEKYKEGKYVLETDRIQQCLARRQQAWQSLRQVSPSPND